MRVVGGFGTLTVPDSPSSAGLGGLFWETGRFGGGSAHRPAGPVAFGGCRVTLAVPVSVGPGGNIPVYFEVLSYAGALTLTVTADPEHFPELGALTEALRAELGVLTGVNG